MKDKNKKELDFCYDGLTNNIIQTRLLGLIAKTQLEIKELLEDK